MTNLSTKRVAVLSTDGVEESEILEPIKALKEAGVTVEVLSPEGKAIQLMKHNEKSQTLQSDGNLANRKADDFDAVVLPGGALNADKLRMDNDAREFVRKMNDEGKLIAAICHAPWLLVSAGLVTGRRMTSYYTVQDDIRNAGGQWSDSEAVVDGNLLTSRSPADLPAFNSKIIASLSAEKAVANPTALG